MRWMDACEDILTFSANMIFELLDRYQSYLAWYQPVKVIDSNPTSFEQLFVSPVEILSIPVTVVIALPEAPLRIPPGLDHTRSGLPFSAELEPDPVRPDSPSVARTAAPRRAPPARDQAPRAVTWHPPPVTAPSAAAAPRTAAPRWERWPGPSRDSDRERRPEPRLPLSESPLAGAPGLGGVSGSAGSAGGSSGGAGTALAALLLVFALTVLDLLRRLRLELARPRSEHIDSFPERPG